MNLRLKLTLALAFGTIAVQGQQQPSNPSLSNTFSNESRGGGNRINIVQINNTGVNVNRNFNIDNGPSPVLFNNTIPVQQARGNRGRGNAQVRVQQQVQATPNTEQRQVRRAPRPEPQMVQVQQLQSMDAIETRGNIATPSLNTNTDVAAPDVQMEWSFSSEDIRADLPPLRFNLPALALKLPALSGSGHKPKITKSKKRNSGYRQHASRSRKINKNKSKKRRVMSNRDCYRF